MNPFVYFGSIVFISPLIGYACFKAFKASFFKVAIIAAIGCASLYFICLICGLRSPGEEGDYALFAILFLFFNILIFQLLKFENYRVAYAAFVLFFSVASIVAGVQAVITASYLYSAISVGF